MPYSNQIIENALQRFKPVIGADYDRYRNHVYRVFMNCILIDKDGANQEKYAIAAVFHDIGIWTDHTIDYLEPSIAQATVYLNETNKEEWIDEISLMIYWHHKISRYSARYLQLVETFRKADWIDVSLGVLTFGYDRKEIMRHRSQFPNLGFHLFLIKKTTEKFLPTSLGPFANVYKIENKNHPKDLRNFQELLAKMAKKALWIVFAALAVIIGLYPVVYFIFDRKFGLLASKTDALLNNFFWNTAFYVHIVFGGIALLIGWMQFSQKIRGKYLTFHRNIGKLYVITVLLSAIAGVYIALFATGGIITSLGFLSLGVIWFCTTLTAYTSIKNGKLREHENMMIYSYSACFAAVTLRIWLPLLGLLFKDFITAYTIVAWLCWVPNLIAATLIIRRKSLTRVSSTI